MSGVHHAADTRAADPFAVRAGSRLRPRRGFWFAGPTFIRPGLFYSRRRVLAVSEWLLRPGFMWRTRSVRRG